jgi:hypothetical protein
LRNIPTWLTLACLLTLASATVVQTQAYPVPSPVPTRWELDFEPDYLRIATMRNPKTDTPEAYWYLTYTVTNNTDTDLQFAPSFIMYDSEGRLQDSAAPARVTRAILALLDNPLIEDELTVSGEIRVGEANAKSGVVIWPVDSATVDEVTIFVGNLSGETATIIDPVDGSEVVLRKTLALFYETPGEVLALLRKSGIEEPNDSLWIMR